MKIHVASFFEPQNHRGRPLSIAMCQPKKFQDIKIITCLLPTWSLVSRYRTGKITKEEYEQIYEDKILKHLTPYILISQILDAVGKRIKEATLLCWEKEGEFCHRTLVYKWLEKQKKERPGIWEVELGEMH